MNKKYIISVLVAVIVFTISTTIMSSTINADHLPDKSASTVTYTTYPSETSETAANEEFIIQEKDLEPIDIKSAPGRDIDTLAREYLNANNNNSCKNYPFIDAVNTDRVVWYTGNMKLCSEDISSTEYDWTEEDLDWMAKIIHCEICVQGDEARRAVGTVVMNRIEWNKCPDTVLGVISQEKQFSPWGNGKIFSAEPCEQCKEAAYDVLVNGYRSFPREVRYFESIKDGYFDNVLTYAYFSESGFNTWFGFDPDDVNEPNI